MEPFAQRGGGVFGPPRPLPPLAFDYRVAEHWGESRSVQFREWDSNLLESGRTVLCYTYFSGKILRETESRFSFGKQTVGVLCKIKKNPPSSVYDEHMQENTHTPNTKLKSAYNCQCVIRRMEFLQSLSVLFVNTCRSIGTCQSNANFNGQSEAGCSR